MKYLGYSYLLDVPIESAFRQVIDLASLHENSQFLGQGTTLTSDDAAPEVVGKHYLLRVETGSGAVETTLAVERIDIPYRIHLSYRYRLIDHQGRVIEGRILPWESMDCYMHFSEEEGKTKVKAIVIANGVRTFAQRTFTRLLSIGNWFQQRGVNKRVKAYIEERE